MTSISLSDIGARWLLAGTCLDTIEHTGWPGNGRGQPDLTIRDEAGVTLDNIEA